MARGYVVEVFNKELNVIEDVLVEIPHEIDETNWRSTLDEAEKKALEFAQTKFGWKEENIICASVNAMSVHLPEGRKIIGTCKECKWWSKDERFCDRWYGKCSCDGSNNVFFKTREDFGCIHWERREERKEE